MSSCSFCGHEDSSDTIFLVCEGRHLICSSCLHQKTILHLFVTALKKSRPGKCPICFAYIASSMEHTLSSIRKEHLQGGEISKNPSGSTAHEIDLCEEISPFHTFIRQFSNTYGYGDELLHQPDHVSVDNNSVGTSAAGSESKRKITARGKNNSAILTNAASNAQNSRKSAGNIRRKTELLDGQVKLSVAEILQISEDAYVSHWANYISNASEPFVSSLMKNLTKKRLLMREANDMKIKAMIDLLSAPTPGERSPLTELFGKIIGLPFNKSHTFRPVWGTIATILIAGTYCDNFHLEKTREKDRQVSVDMIDGKQIERVLDAQSGAGANSSGHGNPGGVDMNLSSLGFKFHDSPPSAQELRKRLSKHYNVLANATARRYITLQKAIDLLRSLTTSVNPYWTMAPLVYRCAEYRLAMPWNENAVADLIQKLFENARVKSLALRKAKRGARTRRSFAKRTVRVSMEDVSSPTSPKKLSVAAAAAATTAAMSPMTPTAKTPKTSIALTREESTMSRRSVSGKETGRRSIDGTNANMNVSRRSLVDSPHAGQSQRKSIRAVISAAVAEVEAAQIANAGTAKATSEPVELVSALAALQVPHDTENVDDDNVAPTGRMTAVSRHKSDRVERLTYESAISQAIREGLSIQIEEFVLICLESWEAECHRILTEIDRYVTQGPRRFAVCKVFDPSIISLTAEESMTMKKLAQWLELPDTRFEYSHLFVDPSTFRKVPVVIPTPVTPTTPLTPTRGSRSRSDSRVSTAAGERPERSERKKEKDAAAAQEGKDESQSQSQWHPKEEVDDGTAHVVNAYHLQMQGHREREQRGSENEPEELLIDWDYWKILHERKELRVPFHVSPELLTEWTPAELSYILKFEKLSLEKRRVIQEMEEIISSNEFLSGEYDSALKRRIDSVVSRAKALMSGLFRGKYFMSNTNADEEADLPDEADVGASSPVKLQASMKQASLKRIASSKKMPQPKGDGGGQRFFTCTEEDARNNAELRDLVDVLSDFTSRPAGGGGDNGEDEEDICQSSPSVKWGLPEGLSELERAAEDCDGVGTDGVQASVRSLGVAGDENESTGAATSVRTDESAREAFPTNSSPGSRSKSRYRKTYSPSSHHHSLPPIQPASATLLSPGGTQTVKPVLGADPKETEAVASGGLAYYSRAKARKDFVYCGSINTDLRFPFVGAPSSVSPTGVSERATEPPLLIPSKSSKSLNGAGEDSPPPPTGKKLISESLTNKKGKPIHLVDVASFTSKMLSTLEPHPMDMKFAGDDENEEENWEEGEVVDESGNVVKIYKDDHPPTVDGYDERLMNMMTSWHPMETRKDLIEVEYTYDDMGDQQRDADDMSVMSSFSMKSTVTPKTARTTATNAGFGQGYRQKSPTKNVLTPQQYFENLLPSMQLTAPEIVFPALPDIAQIVKAARSTPKASGAATKGARGAAGVGVGAAGILKGSPNRRKGSRYDMASVKEDEDEAPKDDASETAETTGTLSSKRAFGASDFLSQKDDLDSFASLSLESGEIIDAFVEDGPENVGKAVPALGKVKLNLPGSRSAHQSVKTARINAPAGAGGGGNTARSKRSESLASIYSRGGSESSSANILILVEALAAEEAEEEEQNKPTKLYDAEDIRLSKIISKETDLSDRGLGPEEFLITMETHFNKKQLKKLEMVNLGGNHIGTRGATLLSKRLRFSRCRFVHLCLADSLMGDLGCSMLVDALVSSGCGKTLSHLDLRGNSITLSAGSIEGIGQLEKLRSLDLSCNHITTDVQKQRETIHAMLSPLKELRYLILAHNKLQDEGLAMIASLICDHLKELLFVDISHCFLTAPRCMKDMERLIVSTHPQLETVLCAGNMFSAKEQGLLKHLCELCVSDSAEQGIVIKKCDLHFEKWQPTKITFERTNEILTMPSRPAPEKALWMR